MGDLERNFSRWEFACHCYGRFCEGYPEDPTKVPAVARYLQKLRDVVGGALGFEVGFKIGRGHSCKEWNDNHVTGASDVSHHKYDDWPVGEGGADVTPLEDGKVMDGKRLQETLEVIAQEAYALGYRGIKKYSGHAHLDRRPDPWLIRFVPVVHIPIKKEKEDQ